jgi:hypothetical protein
LYNVSRRTFKELVDDVLKWTGDEDDQAQMRDLAEQAVRSSHEQRLTADRYTFMIFPKVQTFSTASTKRTYSLHEAFLSPLYFKNLTSGEPVRPVAFQRMGEFQSVATGSMEFVALQGVSKVQNQPAEASTITATSSNVGDNGRTVTVIGETASGISAENLTVGGGAGVLSFLPEGIIDVIKHGEDWLGTLTLTASDSTVVLTLSAAEYGRQFRQLFSLNPLSGGETVEYQFFRAPKPLRYDTDIPDTPYPFDRIHTLDALVALSGFTRATDREVKLWKDQITDLENQLAAHYQDGLTADSEVNYTVLVER